LQAFPLPYNPKGFVARLGRSKRLELVKGCESHDKTPKFKKTRWDVHGKVVVYFLACGQHGEQLSSGVHLPPFGQFAAHLLEQLPAFGQHGEQLLLGVHLPPFGQLVAQSPQQQPPLQAAATIINYRRKNLLETGHAGACRPGKNHQPANRTKQESENVLHLSTPKYLIYPT